MTIQLNLEIIILIGIIIFGLFAIGTIVLICLLHTLRKMQKHITNVERFVYFNTKDIRQSKYMIDDIADQLEQFDTNVQSLTDHIVEQQRIEAEKAKQKHYPKPDEARLIKETIQDQISIEISLSQHLNAPPNDYVDTIISNVIQTYPNIDIEYISKKCFAMLEDTIRDLRSES